jgi:hypothetical protein
MKRRKIATIVTAIAVAAGAAFASSAGASYHLTQIRQIHPSTGMFGGEWVELQMPASGENQVSGKVIRTFFGDGNQSSLYVIGTGPGPHPGAPNGQNQRTILISNLFAPMGVDADFVAPAGALEMTGMDGAVCYTENDNPTYTPIDCVSYGNFTGTLPAGTPAVATPFESTLERGITRGCATALDAADDTNNSSADFALSTRPPRNNSAAPTEVLCPTTAAAPTPPPTCAGKPVTIAGTIGDNTLAGTPRADVIAGLGGNDVIKGLAGNETICGGTGKDRLLGGGGNDKLLGEAGKDTLKGGPGKDKLKGGPGKDVQVQ